MKFTKEEACKHLTSKLSEKGHPLHISERSINEMLDTLMPLLANDDTELEDFVDSVLPSFRTANLNIKNDVSVGIRTYKEQNPQVQTPATPNKKDGEKEGEKQDANADLLRRIAELERKNAENEKNATLTVRRAEISSKLKEKGCKDNEWIDALLGEVNLEGDNFDAEARAERYIKMYNKTEAIAPREKTPKSPNGDIEDKALKGVIESAASYAKAQRLDA